MTKRVVVNFINVYSFYILFLCGQEINYKLFFKYIYIFSNSVKKMQKLFEDLSCLCVVPWRRLFWAKIFSNITENYFIYHTPIILLLHFIFLLKLLLLVPSYNQHANLLDAGDVILPILPTKRINQMSQIKCQLSFLFISKSACYITNLKRNIYVY